MKIEASQVIDSIHRRDRATVAANDRPDSAGVRFERFLADYQQRWSDATSAASENSKGISPEATKLISLQREASSLAFETEVLTRIADGVAASLRKIQQSQA